MGSDQMYWTVKLAESKYFNIADIWNMQPVCVTAQHKLLWPALESSTAVGGYVEWLYGSVT